MRANVWQSALPPLYLVLSNLSVIFIMWFGAKNVLGTGWCQWDIAAFTTFLSCFIKMSTKSSKAAKLFNSVQRAEVSWKRIKPLLKTPAELGALNVPSGVTLDINGLSFAYGGSAPIFGGLTLHAEPGEIIGVTGPVACGKSTLGRVFLNEHPYGGSVKIGSHELSSLGGRDIARAAAADPKVLLLDEITANLDAETEARVLDALRRASAGRTVLSISHRVYENLGGRIIQVQAAS